MYIGIIICFMVLVVLSSGCISSEGFIDSLGLSDNSMNIIELNKTVNNTYSVAGVSFKCPDGWHIIGTNYIDNIIISGFSNTTKYPAFQIQIINNNYIQNSNDPSYTIPENETENGLFSNLNMPGEVVVGNSSNYTSISINNNLSEKQIMDIMRNSTDSLGTKVSSDTITIDGKTAYRDTFVLNNLWPLVIDHRIEQIVFVKNGKAYLMFFEVPNKDYDKEKSNFDMIINSFKIQ